MILTPTSQNIQLAAQALCQGEIVGIPTETVYGLAGDAFNPIAIEKIYALKGRPATNPLIVHISNINQIPQLTSELTTKQEKYLTSLQVFWPGALTVILPKNPKIPSITTAGNNSVAIRIPAHPITQELLKISGLALAAPSANRSNYISPTAATHVEQEFGPALPMIIDGGNCTIGLESTVLNLCEGHPTILRPGAITLEMIQQIIPETIISNKIINADQQQTSPGQLLKHYSPRTPLYFRNQSTNLPKSDNAGLIAFQPISELEQKQYFMYKVLSQNGDLLTIAQQLFSTLRELDLKGLDYIVVDTCEEQDLGLAIMDRLKRAISKE